MPELEVLSPEEARHLGILAVFHHVYALVLAVVFSFAILGIVFGFSMVNQTGYFGPDGIEELRPQPTPDDVLFGREPGEEDPFEEESPDEFASDPVDELLNIAGGGLIGVGTLLTGFGWLHAILTAFAGRCLQKRKRRRLLIGISVLNCFSIPFGTILGIVTLAALRRPSVVQAFART